MENHKSIIPKPKALVTNESPPRLTTHPTTVATQPHTVRMTRKRQGKPRFRKVGGNRNIACLRNKRAAIGCRDVTHREWWRHNSIVSQLLSLSPHCFVTSRRSQLIQIVCARVEVLGLIFTCTLPCIFHQFPKKINRCPSHVSQFTPLLSFWSCIVTSQFTWIVLGGRHYGFTCWRNNWLLLTKERHNSRVWLICSWIS